MKKIELLLTTTMISLFIIACSTDKKSSENSDSSATREMLFNGENLDGWDIYIENDSLTPEQFFYVTDGVIETVGKPMGHLRTKKEYSNYRLHVEWRYPAEPTNSGIYLHTSGSDAAIPNHFQGQLKYKDAGDFIVSGVGLTATVQDSVCTSTAEVRPLIPKLHPTNEKEAEDGWNSYDITCKGDTIELRVNGLLQNVATGCSVTKGAIGLQAEGSRIQFRNLWVEAL